ncbi:Hypothetical protein CINCED_3A020359 [Cinara cedri]|uniref:Uncharacterized protein n=1 Tax=Cinara cedri TaxID=506608 RepID=A0A5E4NGH2_9HEMI|nr:Hypothetical protein CINCED_3A020359 [Cinara cedri]
MSESAASRQNQQSNFTAKCFHFLFALGTVLVVRKLLGLKRTGKKSSTYHIPQYESLRRYSDGTKLYHDNQLFDSPVRSFIEKISLVPVSGVDNAQETNPSAPQRRPERSNKRKSTIRAIPLVSHNKRKRHPRTSYKTSRSCALALELMIGRR